MKPKQDSIVRLENEGLSTETINLALTQHVRSKNTRNIRKVLLVPPDKTRPHSRAGYITNMYYKIFTRSGVKVNILPALGTHAPMTREEQVAFFGEIPEKHFLTHRWRDGVTSIGQISRAYVRVITCGIMDEPIPIQVSSYLLDPSYDLIISIGQVVPHEVAGMANYTKNIAIGCGGSNFINASHMIGAAYGIEKILGKVNTPVRHLLDYIQKFLLAELPLEYALTVIEAEKLIGLYIGEGDSLFQKAALLSRERNINYVDSPIQNCVVYLDKEEFHSTWLGNKAIYRSRMAIADGGNLLVLAPGIKSFGEDSETDRLICKYGYVGRERILELSKSEPELQNNLSVAAHLIHGSSDGRFNITYAAPLLGKEAVENTGYQYMDWDDALGLVAQYSSSNNNTQDWHKTLKPGFNGDMYFIPNPALGLWKLNSQIEW